MDKISQNPHPWDQPVSLTELAQQIEQESGTNAFTEAIDEIANHPGQFTSITTYDREYGEDELPRMVGLRILILRGSNFRHQYAFFAPDVDGEPDPEEIESKKKGVLATTQPLKTQADLSAFNPAVVETLEARGLSVITLLEVCQNQSGKFIMTMHYPEALLEVALLIRDKLLTDSEFYNSAVKSSGKKVVKKYLQGDEELLDAKAVEFAINALSRFDAHLT